MCKVSCRLILLGTPMLGVPFFHLSEILKIDFEGVVRLIKKMNADLYTITKLL